jgi:16S rRNA (adenine1518-N6/adenine1519-N6)-dimethyltransferase
MNAFRTKKALGQHFLMDKNIAHKIVSKINTEKYDKLLEIGPGKGILTQYLFNIPDIDTYVIEIDPEAATYIKAAFPIKQDKIIVKDFLNFDINSFFAEPISIIGNLPYNISSQIFFRLLENRQKVGEIVAMVQKEVADRIVSKEGSKIYGILSVLLQTFYDTKYLFTVNPSVFSPPPKVKSAVIKLNRKDEPPLLNDEKLYFAIVKAAFNQRRKTLRNALKKIGYSIENEYANKRAEQLSVKDFIKLTQLLEKKNKIH